MRTLTILILLIAMLPAIPFFASAQIFNGDLTLSTQAQVDAFDYTEVTGTLTIGYEYGTTFSDINSLGPLSKLTRVGSSLIIRHNNPLQDLQGLENITTLGFFDIAKNPSLTSLQGLENLTDVEGRLFIENNASLTSLQGLDNLSSAHNLRISENAQLPNLQGLENLATIDESLFIENNPQLSSLQGLENLQSLGSLFIEENPNLNDCCAIARLLSKVTGTKTIKGNGINCNLVEIIQENCGIVNLTLRTQAEVDAFNYTEVTGSLIIGNPEEDAPSTDITNLKPLSILTHVGYSLTIVNNDQLQDLQGLGNLTSIEGDISITFNPSLTSLQGLNNLTTIGEDLIIESNAGLTSLQDLNNLTTVGENFIIGSNDYITSLQGMENLASVNALSIRDNAQLHNLQGLENLTSIEGDISITSNPSLISLQGLENLTTTGGLIIDGNIRLSSLQSLENLSSLGHLDIIDNDQLQNLQGLENLTTIGGLTIEGNMRLTTLQNLENLASVSGFFIIDNAQLQDLQGLNNLTNPNWGYISGNAGLTSLKGLENLSSLDELAIFDNDQLQNLQGLENLTALTGESGFFSIRGNDGLTSLQGLENLTVVENSLAITDNASLTSLQGLENLTTIVGVHGLGLYITDNASLTSLQGLENLSTIGGASQITGNASLTSLQGLDNITSVHGLRISENAQLQNLQGLENLATIEVLFIENNASLTSLQGLEYLQSLSLVFIENNPNLNDCCAIADVLTKAAGTTTIRDNGSNCNSVEAIQEDCSSTIFNGDLILRTQAEVDAFHYTEVTGSLTIGNPEPGAPSSDIYSLKPLSSLQKVGGSPIELEYISEISGIITNLLIVNNGMLPDLQGLENLENINLSVIAIDNTELKSFHGLENIMRIGDLVVIGNHKLQDFQGLGNIHTIFDNLIIADNEGLTSLQGLDNLSLLDNSLIIIGNERLQDLQGLENLSRVGDITLKNTKLQHLKGLKNLSSVGSINLKDNQALISLQGLENLITIYGSLTIANNNQLSNLKGLEKLQSVENLEITDNPNLNDCCALADIISAVKGTVLMANGPSCNSVEAIQEDCFFLTHFTLVDAISDEDIYDISNDESPAVINISEVGDQLNIRANTGSNRVKSVVFALNGEVVRTENVAPYALAGDNPPGDYFSWTPQLGRYTLTATPCEGKNATGKQGVPISIELLITDQPFAVTNFTLIATVDHSDQLILKEGTFIKLGDYHFTGLNIRANTTGNVGSVVFDLNEIKNYRTENVPPFALGGDNPPGNYYEVPEIKKEGFFELTATPYSMPRGKGTAGTPLVITFKTSVHNITENHVVDFVLVDADADEEIMVIHDESIIDLGKLTATSFNIRAVTQVEEIPGGRVVFDYDGKKNFRTERAAPYALGGDVNGDYAPFPLLNGQHTLKGTVFPEYSPDFYAKSITFKVVNNQEPSARKSNSTSTFSKEAIEEGLTNNFSEAIQKVIVYPNPSEGLLHIKLPDAAQPVALYLYNAQGHQVMETTGGSEGVVLDISHLAAGMYVLKVASEQRIETHRILLK